MNVLTVVLVPWESSRPLQTLEIDIDHALDETLANKIAPDKHSMLNVIKTLLVRPSDHSPGLYAHHLPDQNQPNVRATRLAMACGLFAMRLRGDVVLSLSARQSSLAIEDVECACCISQDLRPCILAELSPSGVSLSVPEWLGNASRSNYHDAAVLKRLAEVMKPTSGNDDNSSEGDEHNKSSRSDDIDTTQDEKICITREFVTTVPLCLHCRRPALHLCEVCSGAYFCDPPSMCRQDW